MPPCLADPPCSPPVLPSTMWLGGTPGAGAQPRRHGSSTWEGLQLGPPLAKRPLPRGQPGLSPSQPSRLPGPCSGSDVHCLGSRCLFDVCFPLPVLEVTPLPSPADNAIKPHGTIILYISIYHIISIIPFPTWSLSLFE